MKTIVNIISNDRPISAYLFVKEMYEPGDRLLYISAKDTEDDLEWLAQIDGVPASFIDEIVLKNDNDKFKYEKICRTVKARLHRDDHYYVNLAGGTRYMALAIQQAFKEYNSDFFYTNLVDNTIVQSEFDDNIYNNDDFSYPIKYKMSINEYLRAHELETDQEQTEHKPLYSFAMCEHMFKLYSQNMLSNNDWHIMSKLRENYRNIKRGVSISYIENPPHKEWLRIPDIRDFLSFIQLRPEGNKLSQSQIEWITGGWFEEYMYYRIKKALAPDDIQLGVYISRKGLKHNNELDVVFIKNNHLYVVECKTGVHTDSLFNEIVYKACALREALLGLSCNSYIASLKQDPDDDLKKIAQNMGVVFWDYTVITKKLNKVLSKLKASI